MSLKLIYCIINGVPRDFNQNVAALAATVTCCLCSAAISVPTITGGSRDGGPFSTMLLIITIFPLFRTSSTTVIPTFYTGTQKSKTCEKIAPYRYWVKTSKLRAKASNTICVKTCSRSTKMALIESKFSKIFLESMPPDPPKVVTVLILLQTDSAGKSTLKNVKL